MQNEYLDRLGLNTGATIQDIKSAYRELAKKYHPDMSSDERAREQFIKITEAYKFLTDVGPRPNHEHVGYDYDPHQDQYAAWREKAKAFARQKARERAFYQQQLLFRIYRIFNYVNIFILGLNLLVTIDFFLPAKPHLERVMAVSEIYHSTRDHQRHVNDQVFFQSFKIKVEKDAAEGIADNRAVVYTTPVIGFIQHAEVQLDDEVRVLKPAYGIYNIFRIIIPIVLVCGIIYYFLSYYHINKITLVIILTTALLCQLLLIFNFAY